MDVIEELVLPYDPTGSTQTLVQRRRVFRGRLISLGITVLLMVIFYLWQRTMFSTALFVFYGVVLAISVGLTVFRLVRFLQARGEVARMRQGVAVRIGRGGVQVGDVGTAWAGVGGLRAGRGGFGRGPVLQLQTTGGATGSVPLDQIAVFPATLDSTARAYSGGRHGVDLSALDT